MEGVKYKLFRTALETLYFSGAYMALRPLLGGAGAILMLHHVRPPRRDRFQPNGLLEVTPQFFEGVVQGLRRSKVDVVPLDEMHRRMTVGDLSRRFVCITFDDGYRDNLEFAYPILKTYEVPFAIYVAADFAERTGELWWLVLEAVIAKNKQVELRMEGAARRLETDTARDKRAAFDRIYAWLRQLKTESELRDAVRDLASRHSVDVGAFCLDLCMDWQQLSVLAADPLVTIGAHTVSHPILTKLDDASMRAELEGSRRAIERRLGIRPQHLAYPVGDHASAGPREFAMASELGFKTAVTTRPGVVFRQHAEHLTALPRISLNGNFQSPRYAKVLMSGAATGLWNGFRPLNVT